MGDVTTTADAIVTDGAVASSSTTPSGRGMTRRMLPPRPRPFSRMPWSMRRSRMDQNRSSGHLSCFKRETFPTRVPSVGIFSRRAFWYSRMLSSERLSSDMTDLLQAFVERAPLALIAKLGLSAVRREALFLAEEVADARADLMGTRPKEEESPSSTSSRRWEIQYRSNAATCPALVRPSIGSMKSASALVRAASSTSSLTRATLNTDSEPQTEHLLISPT